MHSLDDEFHEGSSPFSERCLDFVELRSVQGSEKIRNY
jgi:hypothetical protein